MGIGGFRVEGLGFRMGIGGFRLSGLGFRVWDGYRGV